MHPRRKKRLTIVIFIVLGAAVAVALALYALQQNINLYYTPTQISQGQAPKGRLFRLGGLVKKGSIHHAAKGLEVSFDLTDTVNTIKVQYSGILPDLFRAGQGIVAQGKLNSKGVFVADQVLAKHSEDYMPPEVKKAVQDAKAYQAKMEKEHS